MAWIGVVIAVDGGIPHVESVEFLSPETEAAMANVSPWICLSNLVGEPMPVTVLRQWVRHFNRDDTLLKLATLASQFMQEGESVPDAQRWLVEALERAGENGGPLERAVSAALSDLPTGSPVIAHAATLFAAQQLVLDEADGTSDMNDAQIAFLLLCLNDHIQPLVADDTLTREENTLCNFVFHSLFNHTSDGVHHFLVRTHQVFSQELVGPFSSEEWQQVQQLAFGCSFDTYFHLWLVPLAAASLNPAASHPPTVDRASFETGQAAELYRRWFGAASVPIDQARGALVKDELVSGVPGLSREFFETPYLDNDGTLLALSPWHIYDHIKLATWGKLNKATQQLSGDSGDTRFMETFGYLFEHWCADVVDELAKSPGFRGRVIRPERSGVREIEDIVIVEGDMVALFSVKASLIPAPSLKAARSTTPVLKWLYRFFFATAEVRGGRKYRKGAIRLLDDKVQAIRARKHENEGLPANATILPVLVTFDALADNAAMYRWISLKAHEYGLLDSRPGVRPVTILNPIDLEMLVTLGVAGRSVCETLREKTEPRLQYQAADWFLANRVIAEEPSRLRSVDENWERIVAKTQSMLDEVGLGTTSQADSSHASEEP